MHKLPITAVIITLNEEDKINDCLSSVRFCDEVIIVDSGSNDRTEEIAREHNATFLFQSWLGYGPQKQFAVEQASNNWVLCLDADEVISPELYHSIVETDFESADYAGYKMPRRNHFMGRALLYGEGYPDMSLRIFNIKHGSWSEDEVHECVEVTGSIGTLKGDILHYSEESITTYLSKQNRYTELQARALFRRKKFTTPIRCVASPLARFIKYYFLRLGFLDGLPGFVHINISCFNAFCKYAKLLELQSNEKKHN